MKHERTSDYTTGPRHSKFMVTWYMFDSLTIHSFKSLVFNIWMSFGSELIAVNFIKILGVRNSSTFTIIYLLSRCLKDWARCKSCNLHMKLACFCSLNLSDHITLFAEQISNLGFIIRQLCKLTSYDLPSSNYVNWPNMVYHPATM